MLHLKVSVNVEKKASSFRSPMNHPFRSCVRRTRQINGVGVAELVCGYKELFVCHWREEGHHVVQAVVANGCQLLRPGFYGRIIPSHPLIEYGISEGVKDLQDELTQCLTPMAQSPPATFDWSRSGRSSWDRRTNSRTHPTIMTGTVAFFSQVFKNGWPNLSHKDCKLTYQ